MIHKISIDMNLSQYIQKQIKEGKIDNAEVIRERIVAIEPIYAKPLDYQVLKQKCGLNSRGTALATSTGTTDTMQKIYENGGTICINALNKSTSSAQCIQGYWWQTDTLQLDNIQQGNLKDFE